MPPSKMSAVQEAAAQLGGSATAACQSSSDLVRFRWLLAWQFEVREQILVHRAIQYLWIYTHSYEKNIMAWHGMNCQLPGIPMRLFGMFLALNPTRPRP